MQLHYMWLQALLHMVAGGRSQRAAQAAARGARGGPAARGGLTSYCLLHATHYSLFTSYYVYVPLNTHYLIPDYLTT